MTFLQSVSSLAVTQSKPVAVYRADPRANFIAAALANIDDIRASQERGTMFKRTGSAFVITLRNGIKVMEIDKGKPQFLVESDKAALDFFEQAAKAAEPGEFDSIFEAQRTTRK